MTDRSSPSPKAKPARSKDERRPTVAVLGGGLSGLAAAHALLREGGARAPRVIVFERRPEPGGLARTIRFDGMASDLGPHRIYSAIPEMKQWLREFLGPRQVTVQRSSAMRLRGRYLPYPPRPLDMPAWLAAIGPADAAIFSAGYARARAGAMTRRGRPRHFAEAMRRSLGAPLCETLVFPYARKMWGLEPENISVRVAEVRATMGGLTTVARRVLTPREPEGRETSLSEFGYVEGGVGRLAQMLADDIVKRGGEIRTGARVRRIDVSRGRVTRVHWTPQDRTDGGASPEEGGPMGSQDVDFAVAALPLAELAGMLQTAGEHPAPGAGEASPKAGEPVLATGEPVLDTGEPVLTTGVREAADGLRTLDLYLTLVTLDRDDVGPEQWYYFPEAEPDINRVSAPARFDPGLGRPGRMLLCLESTRLHGQPGDDTPPDPDRLARQLADTGLFKPGDILETHLEHVPDAYPLLDVESTARLARVLEALSHVVNLLPLGRQGLFQHNNMDHAIHAGLRAGRLILENDEPGPHWHRVEIPRFQEFRIVD